MNSLTYFSRAWSAEQIRLKHTWVWKLMFLSPLFVCGMYFCIFYFEGAHFLKDDSNAWSGFVNTTSRTVFILFLPLFIIIFTLLHQQLDHQANIRKLVYTLPTPQWAQLLAQWLNVIFLYTLTFVWYILLLLLSGWVLSLLRPTLGFDQIAVSQPLLGIFNGYVASLGILAFQFVLSYFFRNMIVPLSIGIAGFISAMVLLNWKHVVYHPFSYQVFAFLKTIGMEGEGNAVFIQPVLFGLGTMALVLLVGYLARKKANIAG